MNKYLMIFDEFGYFGESTYSFISPIKNKISITLDDFSYDNLVLSFYYDNLEYILKYQNQCITFELFQNISENTYQFDICYLINNKYIVQEYLKLENEDKEILRINTAINKLFQEIEAILDLENF